MNTVNYTFMYIALNAITFGRAQTQRNGRCDDMNGRKWECKSLQECPVLLNILVEKTPSPQDIEILSELICDFDGKIPRVCCPLSQSPPDHTHRPPTNNKEPGTSIIDVKNHPRLRSLLPESCGFLREDNKIIMGEAAALYEFPWMALLGYQSVRGFDYRCDGSLINKRYVLTAAHCLKNRNYKLVSVRLGEYDLSRYRDCGDTCAPPVQEKGIEEIIPHPQYSSTSWKNDIGLIRLSTDVVFNEATIPICLPVGRDEQSKELSGQKVTVTGWGRTEYAEKSSILLKVDLPIVPRNQCAEQYKNHQTDIDASQFCAGTGKGKDSCTGDSGGPMQAITTRNGETVYMQYGIVSFGPSSCGNSNLPGVYTRIGLYMQWILDTMRP